ncbi:hypothetical protein VP1G_09094 [Cytospora mali]|uniref:Uncharacterized protein n=1 Tax=Cytospora mali TaxID=578113 RepID=A0A194VD74_CYTMA|nr:hypothetical protein VP1G_09094 [Valsa mali var. pyri (nom. inval.)]
MWLLWTAGETLSRLCHLETVQSSEPLFYFFADVLYFVFIGAGAILLLMIVLKYVRTRRELNAWTWVFATGYTRGGSSASRAYRLDGERTSSSDSTVQQQEQQFQPKGIYDSWLLLRLCIAFACLCIFEFNTVIVQITGHADMVADASRSTPDLSPERARRDFALLMPGAIASVLAFVTFGTTQQFRQTMYRTFVPKQWQQKEEEHVAGFTRAPPRLDIAVTSAEHSEQEHERGGDPDPSSDSNPEPEPARDG